MKKKYIIPIVSLVSALVLSNCVNPSSSASATDKNEFDFCWYALSALFVYQERLPANPYVYATPLELYQSVNDTYTRYWNPAEATSLLASLTTQSGGIGIFIDSVATGYLVKQVFKNSPGEKAGLLAGDTIQTANGRSVAGVLQDSLSQYLGGNQGDSMSLLVNRNGTLLTIRVILGTYFAPSVVFEALDSSVAYIALRQFSEETLHPLGSTGEFSDALDSTAWAQYTVLDLRGNTGGAVTQCISITSQFVPLNTVIITTKERDADSLHPNGITIDSELDAVAGQKALTRKFEVLVDHYTASASEILVNCLRERRASTVKTIGTLTYGKGSGWGYVDTPKNGLVTITTLLLIPVINPIYNHIGITPDVVVDSTTDALTIALSDIGGGGLGKRLAISKNVNRINRLLDQLPKQSKIPMCIVK
jgi:carboxyl-terminal processing protease